MIYDQMKKVSFYKGLAKNLDAAIDYLLKTDITKIPDGKHPIIGDSLIVQASHYETKSVAEARLEAHRKYIDIQIVLSGAEGCYFIPAEGLKEDGPFETDRDVGFYKAEEKACFPLEAGVFAIFFPWDAHKPSCDLNGKRSSIHKVILKVLL